MKKILSLVFILMWGITALAQAPTPSAIFNPMPIGAIPAVVRYSGGTPVFGAGSFTALFGAGAPTGPCNTEGQKYYNTSATPYIEYICHLTAWIQVGSSSSQVWPAAAGIMVYAGGSAFGTSLAIPLPILSGGTGSTSASAALTALGAQPAGSYALTSQLPQTRNVIAHQFFISYNAGTGLFASSTVDYSDLTNTPVLAQTLANASHKWLNSYTAATGAFTQTQPASTDLSDLPIPIPSGGTGATSAAAALTALGAQAALPANNTFTVGTTTINANTCTSTATVAITGVTTASAFYISPSTDVAAVTGWGSSGGLIVDAWPTLNTLNYKVCNQTTSNITPSGSVTFNVAAK